jgi:hypothetical protein
MNSQVRVFQEPLLEFGHGQRSANPKAGMYFFGPPLEKGSPKHIKVGVVATQTGADLYRRWAKILNRSIPALAENSLNHVPFPGFHSLTGATISEQPEREELIGPGRLASAIRLGKRHEAIKATVSIYEAAIRKNLDENYTIDVWFVVIPDEIYRYGRPKSVVPRSEALSSKLDISKRRAAEILSGARSLFEDENEQAETFLFEPNFHHQLKARLLDNRSVVIQIVRESTLEALVERDNSSSKRRLQDAASIAWNLSTTLYFKAGGQPWKLSFVRPRVCYIGLVFKLFPDTIGDERKACCGAQMFLDSGDGLVFRGTPGDYYNPRTKQFHLGKEEAQRLVERVVAAYKDRDSENQPPLELVIHGRTRFNKDECDGFAAGAPDSAVTTIRISEAADLRLFAPRDTPVLRGTAVRIDQRRGYLWTKGLIPDLGTYPGREVPKPVSVDIVSGETPLDTVFEDLLMLTKLNFNSCVFADGSPVTLRFADAVGEIITAVPEQYAMGTKAPMPFKHYI